MQEEGLCLGTSSGINVAGAIRLARKLGPGHNIVTVLCDLGTRYTGKMFNVPFLQEKGLPTPTWLESEDLSSEITEAMGRTVIPDEQAAAEQAAYVAKAAEEAARAAAQ